MKKLFFLIVTIISISTFATTTNYHRYNKPFIFVENGIEFAVFNDGQFDFNILQSNQTSIHINTRNINFSFNSGHNYNTYVQRDDYGAVIQIENTPVYYDYYGRVKQIGHTNMYYNNYGFATRIGNLHISYNNYGNYYGHTGNINSYRCDYSPRHNYYCVPPRNRCVINAAPYRRAYTPHRYKYHYSNHSKRYVEKPRYYVSTPSRNYRYATPQRKYNSRSYNKYNRYSNNNSSKKYTRKYTTPKRNNYSGNSRQYTPLKSTTQNQRSYTSRSIAKNPRSYTSRSITQRSYKKPERKYTSKRSYVSNNTSGRRTYKRR